MDPLDAASEVALATQLRPLPTHLATRPVTPAELDRLLSHLVDTEMSIPDALFALRLDVQSLTLDDLDRVADRITRCTDCRCWTGNKYLTAGRCPACAHLDEGE